MRGLESYYLTLVGMVWIVYEAYFHSRVVARLVYDYLKEKRRRARILRAMDQALAEYMT